MDIYGFTVKGQDGSDISLEAYRGQVLLIVNTATECGFTPQYQGLEAIYEEYSKQGFTILDFPCNQFHGQAPGTNEEIHAFCTGRFGVTFPQFGKIDVNGPEESPLYSFLKKERPGLAGSDIKWNFTKFLIDRNGSVVKRYGSPKKPEAIRKDIEKLL